MTEDKSKKIVQPLDIKDEARPHSLTGGDIQWPAMPPAEESIAENIRLGLLVRAEDGSLKPGPNIPKIKAGWGAYELIELVETLWPDIPARGVPWEDVVARARRGNILISLHGLKDDGHIYQKSPL